MCFSHAVRPLSPYRCSKGRIEKSKEPCPSKRVSAIDDQRVASTDHMHRSRDMNIKSSCVSVMEIERVSRKDRALCSGERPPPAIIDVLCLHLKRGKKMSDRFCSSMLGVWSPIIVRHTTRKSIIQSSCRTMTTSTDLF